MSIFGLNKRRVLNKVSGNIQLTRALTVPTGGTPYTVNGSQYYVFTGSGTVNATAQNPASITYNTRSGIISSVVLGAGMDVLMVAGGGGGGGGAHDCGGGGAGGMIYAENVAVPAESHPISIGGGGGSYGAGGDTTFGTFLTAKGGGHGTTDEGPTAGSGGSGGGGGFRPNNFRPSNAGGPGIQPSQPGISGSSGHGHPGQPAGPGGNQGGNGGGATPSPGGSSRAVPSEFLPTSGFPNPFLGAPTSNPTQYVHFAGGGHGSSFPTGSSIPTSFPNRGVGGNGAPAGSYSPGTSGSSGVIIIKVR